MYIAFYKHETREFKDYIYGYLIAYFQKLKGRSNWNYTHVEVYKELEYIEVWYGATANNGVRKRAKEKVRHRNWDVYKVNMDKLNSDPINWFENELGKGYDYLGIFLSELINLDIDNKNRYYCSEAVCEAFNLEKDKMDVAELFNYLIENNYIQAV